MISTDLHRLLSGDSPPILLHVLPEEAFRGMHIPESINACVYETAFSAKVAELVPDLSAAIVVYGAGGSSRDAATACAILRALGYKDVQVLEDGITGWAAAGLPTEGTGALPDESPLPTDGIYRVDPEASLIRWTGRNLFNHHSGSVRLSGGHLEVTGGRLTDATFLVDMRTLTCEDITDSTMNKLLIDHLMSADFFHVTEHPEAVFSTRTCSRVEGTSPGSENFRIAGEATVRGVTRPLDFPVVVAVAGPGQLVGQAQIALDRTEFGSLYGSGRFFRFLGKHVVNDAVHLHLKVRAVQGDE